MFDEKAKLTKDIATVRKSIKFQTDLRYDFLPLKRKPETIIFVIASIVKIIVIIMLIQSTTMFNKLVGSLSGLSSDKVTVDIIIATVVKFSKCFQKTNCANLILKIFKGPKTNKLLPYKSNLWLVFYFSILIKSSFVILAIDTAKF